MTYLIEHDIRMPCACAAARAKASWNGGASVAPPCSISSPIRSMRAFTLTACVRSIGEGKSPAVRERDADRRAPKRPKSFCAFDCRLHQL